MKTNEKTKSSLNLKCYLRNEKKKKKKVKANDSVPRVDSQHRSRGYRSETWCLVKWKGATWARKETGPTPVGLERAGPSNSLTWLLYETFDLFRFFLFPHVERAAGFGAVDRFPLPRDLMNQSNSFLDKMNPKDKKEKKKQKNQNPHPLSFFFFCFPTDRLSQTGFGF